MNMDIRYGFHAPDLFFPEDEEKYDILASTQKYAEQVKEAIGGTFPQANIEVVYDFGGGALPYSLWCTVDGFADDQLVYLIEDIAGEVYTAYGWVVKFPRQ